MENQNILLDYVDEFADALCEQLTSDFERWGETWRKRDIGNAPRRNMARCVDYLDQCEHGGVPYPWLKEAGNVFICWLRDRHPELLDR